MILKIASTEEMESLGSIIAQKVVPGSQIHLSGPLGAGKTTLVRGFLRGFDYAGKVKSPTFTLVEPYEFDNLWIYHFDLYRIESPLELDAIGFREYPGTDSICLIEWPEKAGTYLKDPDLFIKIKIIDDGREIQVEVRTNAGQAIIKEVSSVFST